MGSGSTANIKGIKGIERAMNEGIISPACQKVLFEEHNKGFLREPLGQGAQLSGLIGTPI